ncbi:hypothetical protein MMC06_001670, partial [Schaereria dolodes]|nr:hypothetical protein [Schaereria dolodes]
MNRGSPFDRNDDSDDLVNNQQDDGQQDDGQQDDGQQDDGQQDDGQQDDGQQDDEQKDASDEAQSNDGEEQEQGEEAVDPSIRVIPTRTQSDPLPSQEEQRDKADADYHPEIVMLPDSDEDEDGGDDSEIKFTATLDSGCDDNWISWTKMEEHHLGTDKVESLTDRPGQLPSEFSDFNGNDVEPVGQVQLRWRASGSGRSDESVFYVIDNEDAPFDVLFGRTFMDEHDGGPNFFKKPVLINAGKPLSTAEKARLQLGVEGTSAFVEPQLENEDTSGPTQTTADVNNPDTEADEPVPTKQHE